MRGARGAGVQVCIAQDSAEPAKPDAVFPNNWVSWHHDGSVVLYPMLAPNRRAERRAGILASAARRSGFRRRRLIDLSAHEHEGRFLEGTGSLVLDHLQRVAYACRSARTDESLVRAWGELMGYEPLVFDAGDEDGRAIYHTNVMLALGTRWALVCGPAIAAADRARVLARLRASGRELIQIGMQAMRSFAGNLLELAGRDARGRARSVLALSTRARAALLTEPGAWRALNGLVDEVVAVEVPTIESIGGGGVRCMLAEDPGDGAGRRGAMSAKAPLARAVYAILADRAFHSGTALAQHCAVSRSAIWKAVAALRALGVQVEAVANRGYRCTGCHAAAGCRPHRRTAAARHRLAAATGAAPLVDRLDQCGSAAADRPRRRAGSTF